MISYNIPSNTGYNHVYELIGLFSAVREYDPFNVSLGSTCLVQCAYLQVRRFDNLKELQKIVMSMFPLLSLALTTLILQGYRAT